MKAYIQYVERLAKRYNAVDGDFLRRHRVSILEILNVFIRLKLMTTKPMLSPGRKFEKYRILPALIGRYEADFIAQ